jgi:hypothetical protein
VAGSDANSTDVGRESVMMDCDFSVCNLQEEQEHGGWLKTTTPEGGPVPEIITAGTRGYESPQNQSVSRIK